MIPETILGLVLFAASAGPGYLYVRLARVRAPRRQGSQLEEAAELVFFGATASAIAGLAVLSAGGALGLLDPEILLEDPLAYLGESPFRVLVALVAVLGLSYGAVWALTTKMLYPQEASISPGETPWYAVFRRMLPEDHGTWATVELRDGTALAGLVITYTADDVAPREIVLGAPAGGSMWRRGKSGEATELPDDFVIIDAKDALAVSGRYTKVEN